jgi:hypothetical protein
MPSFVAIFVVALASSTRSPALLSMQPRWSCGSTHASRASALGLTISSHENSIQN